MTDSELLAAIREIAARAPVCDKYKEDSAITCGWRSDLMAIKRLLEEQS